MAETISLIEGETFAVSNFRGDIDRGSSHGLFHRDTRYLSHYSLRLIGEELTLLSSAPVDYYSASFFLTNKQSDRLEAGTLSVIRHRFVGDGLHEDVIVVNHSSEEISFQLSLEINNDFADVLEVKAQHRPRRWGVMTSRYMPKINGVLISHRHIEFYRASQVAFTQPFQWVENKCIFEIKLGPGDRWKSCVTVDLVNEDKTLRPRYACNDFNRGEQGERGEGVDKWRSQLPVLETDWDDLQHLWEKSVEDLTALRLRVGLADNVHQLLAAGVPWFMAIFGRDTLITGYESMILSPELARGALRALAERQGKKIDPYKEEEPGRILHEIRFGELAMTGEAPHYPYFGSVDSTPLFIIVASEVYRWDGDRELVNELKDSLLAAVDWIDNYGDSDGDGYIEYLRKSSKGLENQGWKDSGNSILFADGRMAVPPIALCEAQGYVYDAKVRLAELAAEVWGDDGLAGKLRGEAASLKERFNKDFWIEGVSAVGAQDAAVTQPGDTAAMNAAAATATAQPDATSPGDSSSARPAARAANARGGYFALALDKDKRPVDSLTSNIGHLLWSGIVDGEKAELVRDELVSASMWTSRGIRTMSSDDAGYSPIVYHNGTVWPHDNALIAEGLARYGFIDDAKSIISAVTDAGKHFDYRLPEVFAGYNSDESKFPVEYPTSCSPQAWSAAAVVQFVTIMLGIRPGRSGQPMRLEPKLPAECGKLTVHGLPYMGRRFDVTVSSAGASQITEITETSKD